MEAHRSVDPPLAEPGPPALRRRGRARLAAVATAGLAALWCAVAWRVELCRALAPPPRAGLDDLIIYSAYGLVGLVVVIGALRFGRASRAELGLVGVRGGTLARWGIAALAVVVLKQLLLLKWMSPADQQAVIDRLAAADHGRWGLPAPWEDVDLAAVGVALYGRLIGPAAEELVYRCVLLAALTRLVARSWAVLASALVFFAAHTLVYGQPDWIIETLVLGLLCGALFVRYRSWAPGLVVHIASNAGVELASVMIVAMSRRGLV